MGTDKGLLPFKGKKIVQWVIEHIQPCVDEVFIVSGNETYAQFGKKLVADELKDAGPAGGIHAALKHCTSSKLLVAACDMPFISTEAADFLIKESVTADICIPLFKQKTEPLFGVYSKNCLAVWEDALKRGVFKLQDIFSFFETKYVDVDSHPLFGENFFTNINTKEDLHKAGLI